MERMGEAVAVFPAAKERIRSHDSTFPFRQDSDFHYLTGSPAPGMRSRRSGPAAGTALPAPRSFSEPMRPFP